jgi:hypothetical protein
MRAAGFLDSPDGTTMNTIYFLTASVLLLAGCASAPASSLAFDGKGNGTHSDTATCDDAGTIKGRGNVADGSVLVTLKDSAGKQLFQQTFKGEFTLESKPVSGASGTWTIDGSRSSDDTLGGDPFSGNYSFNLSC